MRIALLLMLLLLLVVMLAAACSCFFCTPLFAMALVLVLVNMVLMHARVAASKELSSSGMA
jgi:hypothetical protein